MVVYCSGDIYGAVASNAASVDITKSSSVTNDPVSKECFYRWNDHHANEYVFFLLLLLFQAFDVVEKSYFDTIDDALAEKAHMSTYVVPHSEVQIHAWPSSA